MCEPSPPLSIASVLYKGSGIRVTTGHVPFNETPADLQRCKHLFFMKWQRAKWKGGEQLCTWLKFLGFFFSIKVKCPGALGSKSKLGFQLCVSLEEKIMGIEAIGQKSPVGSMLLMWTAEWNLNMWFSLWGASLMTVLKWTPAVGKWPCQTTWQQWDNGLSWEVRNIKSKSEKKWLPWQFSLLRYIVAWRWFLPFLRPWNKSCIAQSEIAIIFNLVCKDNMYLPPQTKKLGLH